MEHGDGMIMKDIEVRGLHESMQCEVHRRCVQSHHSKSSDGPSLDPRGEREGGGGGGGGYAAVHLRVALNAISTLSGLQRASLQLKISK